MAQIAVNPFVLKDVTLKVDADNFEAHVSEVLIAPSTNMQTWQGLTPDASFTDTSSATWTCRLSYAQDLSEGSLARYLYDNEGASIPVEFVPQVGSNQPTVQATIVIAPGPIGGTVNQWATGTVTLGVSGRPTLVDPA